MNINSTKLCASTVGRYMFYCIHVVLGSKTVLVEEVSEEKKTIPATQQ